MKGTWKIHVGPGYDVWEYLNRVHKHVPWHFSELRMSWHENWWTVKVIGISVEEAVGVAVEKLNIFAALLHIHTWSQPATHLSQVSGKHSSTTPEACSEMDL